MRAQRLVQSVLHGPKWLPSLHCRTVERKQLDLFANRKFTGEAAFSPGCGVGRNGANLVPVAAGDDFELRVGEKV